jgi:hypothetical protein
VGGTGQLCDFFQVSSSGATGMFVLYNYDSNFFRIETAKKQLQRLDNEASKELNQSTMSEDIDFQLAPRAKAIACLAQGLNPDMKNGTDTIHFIPHTDVPGHQIPTDLRIVSSKNQIPPHPLHLWWQRIIYHGKVSTSTTDITTAKILLNSDARFMTIDIKDFYLNTTLPEYEYMRIPVKDIPGIIMHNYKLHDLARNDSVTVEIRKGMYGLPKLVSSPTNASSSTSPSPATTLTNTRQVFAVSNPVPSPSVLLLTTSVSNTSDANKPSTSLLASNPSTPAPPNDLSITLKWNYITRTIDMS